MSTSPPKPSSLIAEGKTIVTTVEGKTLAFGGFLSKFIVTHPRVSVLVTAVVFAALGHFA